jgi:class 3 adenylate cyclase
MKTKELRNVLDAFTTNTLGKAAHRFENRSLQASESVTFMEKALPVDTAQPKEQLRALVGKQSSYPETVGGHPDFDYLTHDQTEHHYIVSVFADIKGSTKLATILPLEDVRQIKNGALATMIDIFHAFDGHIHRLQGDGVLAFFGRKGMRPAQAVIDALNATSFLQYYFQNVLRPMFEAKDYPPIRIRVGIDFGPDEKVLWSRYGIVNCDEVTTTSLHTDLAAKLQGFAKSNGVMIGDNVRDHLDLPDEFYRCKLVTRNGQQASERYVLQYRESVYNMWEFDWDRYLKRFLINPERLNTFRYKAGDHFEYRCYYSENDIWYEYNPNSGPLKTGLRLKFELSGIGFDYHSIVWQVQNRGNDVPEESYEFEMEENRDQTTCPQETAYKGHHYMVCKIYNAGHVVAEERIGVYINND